uniref:Ras-like protein family member 10B-like n=1 Tax=Saccoglossus kowalevskii TaxID=10224 RepID=A0ABM0GRX9_SACKO|nr:PREDICTED: ras-like protein family member 10B-like [Saccoglossus kowalevskii]
MQTIDIAVLGAPAVGKSAIIQQYMHCTFPNQHSPTKSPSTHNPVVLANTRLYQLNIIDTPPLQYFQMKSFYDWVDFHSYSDKVKDASAFILIFDVSNSDSFQYVKDLREQIIDYRGGGMSDVTTVIAGNKCDLGKCNGLSRRDVSHVIRKNWKSGYVECSAKYNWHIVSLFNEVMKLIDANWDKPPTVGKMRGRNSCLIM